MVISGVNTVTYNGDGITTAWPYTFPVTDDSEIRVQLNNADGTAVIVESDYYVDLINSTVYYPGYAPGSEPPEAEQPSKVQEGQTITVYREIPMTQESDLGEKWPFEVIEKGLDKLTMIAQQIDSGTKRKLDDSLAAMELLADVVVDSDELQHITDQYNAIDANAAAAAESEENAAASEENAAASEENAAASATAAANSATQANSSASNAASAETALIAFLEDKETLTAPAVDTTLTVSGAAADAKVVGDTFDKCVIDRYLKYKKDNYITNNLWKNGGSCYLLPISPGQTYRITGGNVSSQFAVLTDDTITVEQTPSFSSASGFTSIKIALTNVTELGIFPDDARFLYVYLGLTGGTDRTPFSLIIDGYEIFSTLKDNIVAVADNVDAQKRSVNEKLSLLGLKFSENIFNKNHVEEGYTNGWIDHSRINYADGSIVTDDGSFAVSYLIPTQNKRKITCCYGSAQYIAQMSRVASYDINKNFIEAASLESEYVLPSNAFYVRIEFDYSGTIKASTIYNRFTVSEESNQSQPYKEYLAPFNNALKINLMQIFPKYTTIGDSLMGGFMNRDGVSVSTATARAAGNNWVNYISLRIGRPFTNLATGGSTAKQWRESLLVNANIPTDCYIIGIGVNDKRQSLTVGTNADIAENFADNADSFYGNYDYMVRQLIAWNPACHIFVFTIPSVESGDTASYNSAIEYIASLYSARVHCIDLYGQYQDMYNIGIVTNNYTGNHFNPVAYNYMSSVIENAINNFMFVNNQLFAVSPYA